MSGSSRIETKASKQGSAEQRNPIAPNTDESILKIIRRMASSKRIKLLDIWPTIDEVKIVSQRKIIGSGTYTGLIPRESKIEYSVDSPHRLLFMDPTRMLFSDNMFDIILCNHVFPFIRSDFMAMSEVHRVLKSDGLVFLSVEMKAGCRTKRGIPKKGSYQESEEWIYGQDYFERLEAAGLFVFEVPIAAASEKLFLGCKFKDTMERFRERYSREKLALGA